MFTPDRSEQMWRGDNCTWLVVSQMTGNVFAMISVQCGYINRFASAGSMAALCPPEHSKNKQALKRFNLEAKFLL